MGAGAEPHTSTARHGPGDPLGAGGQRPGPGYIGQVARAIAFVGDYNTSAMTYDIAIIGGGIVGLATARALLEKAPALKLVLCEKEAELGTHQTGHNSGVIHSGIYYKPGSFKARQCVEGARLMVEFCEAHAIKYDRCGKVIVATSQEEVPRLKTLYERGTTNGVPGLSMLDAAHVREIEPHVRAVAGIHSPNTAIVDYSEVTAALGRELVASGLTIEYKFPVSAITRVRGGGLAVSTPQHTITANKLINCAGLYSDVIARLAGANTEVQIIPFRGEYYFLRPERESLVRGLIYPVPDPECTLGYSGFWAMARKYWRTGAYEMYRSLSKKKFVEALQGLVPDLKGEDIIRGGAGVRAQAVRADGSLVDDFSIASGPDAIHVVNAPSPGATASLAIGRHVAGLATQTFGLV